MRSTPIAPASIAPTGIEAEAIAPEAGANGKSRKDAVNGSVQGRGLRGGGERGGCQQERAKEGFERGKIFERDTRYRAPRKKGPRPPAVTGPRKK